MSLLCPLILIATWAVVVAGHPGCRIKMSPARQRLRLLFVRLAEES